MKKTLALTLALTLAFGSTVNAQELSLQDQNTAMEESISLEEDNAEYSVSGNGISENTVSGNGVSGNSVSDNDLLSVCTIPAVDEEEQETSESFEETVAFETTEAPSETSAEDVSDETSEETTSEEESSQKEPASEESTSEESVSEEPAVPETTEETASEEPSEESSEESSKTQKEVVTSNVPAESYTVTFDADNGSDPVTKSVKASKTCALPKTPVLAGYTFQGWFDADGVKFTAKTKVTGDITLKARYAENTYTLKFAANGGKKTSQTPAGKKLAFTETATLPGAVFTKTGYRLSKWCTKSKITAKGAVTYECGEDVSKLCAKNKGTVTLYAIWEEIACESIEITGTETIYPLQKTALTVTKHPENANGTMKVSSSNPKLAAVSYNAKTGIATVSIKAKRVDAPTEVVITAAFTSKAGNTVKGTDTLTILPSPVTGLSDIEGKSALNIGDETDYTATVSKSSEDGKEDGVISWTSSNAKVLSIDQTGHAKALKGGTVTLKAAVTLATGKTLVKSRKVKVGKPITAITLKANKTKVSSWQEAKVAFSVKTAPSGSAGEIVYTIVSDDTGVSSLEGNVLTIPASSEPGNEVKVRASVKGREEVFSEKTITVVKGKEHVSLGCEIAEKKADGTYAVSVMVGCSLNLKPILSSGERAKNLKYTYNFKKDGKTFKNVDYAGYFLCDYGVLYGFTEGTAEMTITTKEGIATKVEVTVIPYEEEKEYKDDSWRKGSGYYYIDDDEVLWRKSWDMEISNLYTAEDETGFISRGYTEYEWNKTENSYNPSGDYIYRVWICDGDTLRVKRIDDDFWNHV